MWVRDEYAPRFGRQVLTLWSGAFASDYEGEAVELPHHDGYMVTLNYFRPKVRVVCEAPRTEGNFLRVDEAIEQAVKAAIDSTASCAAQ
jgi:hypothetical protein